MLLFPNGCKRTKKWGTWPDKHYARIFERTQLGADLPHSAGCYKVRSDARIWKRGQVAKGRQSIKLSLIILCLIQMQARSSSPGICHSGVMLDIPSHYMALLSHSIVLLCKGYGSLLCSLWRSSRLAIDFVYRVPAHFISFKWRKLAKTPQRASLGCPVGLTLYLRLIAGYYATHAGVHLIEAGLETTFLQ